MDAQFKPVLDVFGNQIRGLYVRNNTYYARMAVDNQIRRIPLEGVTDAEKAYEELLKLKQLKQDDALPIVRRTPMLRDYVKRYLRLCVQSNDKLPATIETERIYLDGWVKHIGNRTHLHKITPDVVRSYVAKQCTNGWANRTTNLAITILQNVLKMGAKEGHIKTLPTDGLKLEQKLKKRDVTDEVLEQVCQAGLDESKNGQQLADYLHLMAYCGSRKTETLRLKWTDVDFDRGVITIRGSQVTEMRDVNFNDPLETLLKDMYAHRAPDSEWVFPSPQRGDLDTHAKSFVESMRLAKQKAGVPNFGFHDCRHLFIVNCIKAGTPHKTIAKWVGHSNEELVKRIGKLAQD